VARDVSEVDLSSYLDKTPTDLQERFAAWLKDAVGFDPSRAKTKEDAFNEGVRLATAMRMIFQASAENQEVLEQRRVEREQGVEEETPKAKKAAKAAAPAKATTKKATAKKVAKVAEEVEEEDEEEAPAPKKATAKKTSPATRNKRRPAPVVDGDEEEAPF